MRRFQQLSSLCLIISLAITLPAFSGCDLGTYSKRSSEFLQKNPGGVEKGMKKDEMKKDESKEDES